MSRVPVSNTSSDPGEIRHGTFYGLMAYFLWGIVVVYWRLADDLDALEVQGHRVLWTLVVIKIALAWRGKLTAVWAVVKDKRLLLLLTVSGLLLGINWTIFVWTVITDQILQASLGYYINPLVSIVIAFFLLGERMNRLQIIAVICAVVGVLLMLVLSGSLPWPALTLAVTFGFYGYIRKIIHIDALVALFVEIAVCIPIALLLIAHAEIGGSGAFSNLRYDAMAVLMGAGIITFAPLYCFGEAARRIRLTTLGFLQYLAPSMHFLLAVLVFNEPLDKGVITAFVLIWIGLGLYSYDLLRHDHLAP